MKCVPLSLFLFLFLSPLAVAQEVPKQEPGYLGCNLIDLADTGRHLLAARGFQATTRVEAVLPDTPAAKAELRTNDIILAFQGSAIKDTKDLIAKIQMSGAGTSVTLSILRDGREKAVEVTLAKSPWIDLEKPDTTHGFSPTRTVKDIAYYSGKDAHPEKHKLDLVFPVSKEPFPVLMWIHGGGWSIGDRSDATALALRFAERGVAVAAISHRLSSAAWHNPEASQSGVVHPAHVQDCARAFAWLRQHIQEYGGDPTRLFVGGHSSGAHLATLLATHPHYLADQNVSLNMIKGVISMEGSYDIGRYWKVIIELDSRAKADAHIHAVFGTQEENWRDASPTNYLSGHTVPILVVTGEEEGFRRYAQHLREAAEHTGKRTIRFVDAKDRVHATIISLMTLKEPDITRKAMLDFIRGG